MSGMRILVLTPSFLPAVGGLEMGVHHLSREWREMGHEVLVLNMVSSRPWHPEANYGVRYLHPLRGGDRFGWHRTPWRQWAEWQIKRAIETFKPDVISAHFAYPCAIWLGQIDPAIPWAIHCHGADVQTLEAFGHGYRLQFDLDALLTRYLRRAAYVIVVSQGMISTIESLGVRAASIVHLPNGADPRLRDSQLSLDVRAKLNLPAGASYLLSVGANSVKKGFDVGIRSFAKIAPLFPNLYYVLLGRGTSQLMDLAHDCDVAERVRTCEGLSGTDLWAAYQQAYCFVSPSRTEGFSLVGVEAMMAGLPLVAASCRGNQEVVVAGENGLLCAVDDAEDMAAQLQRVLADPALREQLAAGSRRSSQRYDWRYIASSYLQLLKASV